MEVFKPEFGTVTQKFQEIAGVVAPGYDHDLVDPCFDQGLNRVIDHRLVVYGQEMFVGDFRKRVKPGTQPAC